MARQRTVKSTPKRGTLTRREVRRVVRQVVQEMLDEEAAQAPPPLFPLPSHHLKLKLSRSVDGRALEARLPI